MNPVPSSGSRNLYCDLTCISLAVGPVISGETLRTHTSIQAPAARGVCSVCDWSRPFITKESVYTNSSSIEAKI